MARELKHFETKLIHAGEPSPPIHGAVAMPIFQSSTFTYSGETSYEDVRYIRLSNTPNHLALHQKLAAIEGAEAAIATSSGMAAIATTLLTFLSAGDHLLAQRCLYGGTYDLITRDFARFGLSFDFIDAGDKASWASLVKPSTKAIYVEAMTNPLLEVADLAGVAAFARERGLISIIDSTFASPVNFRPVELGFDLVIHSCSKYLNGHSDIVAGAVIGSRAHIRAVTAKLSHLGGSLDPHAASLLHRGMKTLALRVRQQNESALALALFLSRHPSVARVNYAGLESHPGHARARELFQGFGGVLSFELAGGEEATARFLSKLTLPILAPSLGGVETLIIRPAVTSHAGLAPEDRRALGISDTLVRVSVGIESTADILEDFAQALAAL